jgi:serine/threonine protein kinase
METPEFEYIGPYRVVRTLGQGGMGTVYHGVNNKTNDPVAIKVISAGMAQHQRFRRRFDAEIQTLLKLKHPGIVQLIGFGEEKGLLFYSMEYVDGENLQQLLRREKRMAWPRVIDMAIEICSALKHAHDFGIIHRDLKPANLMINSQGRVKLTDFGIAKLFGGADSTVEGSVLGTADFMPPEQAEGKPVSVRSDLYSLGSVCYAALTGRAPFQGKTIPEVLFNVRYGAITPIASLAPDTPTELCDLVEELLAREPSLRPPTGLVVGNRFQSLKMGLANRPQSPRVNVDVSHLKELTSIDLNDNPSILPSPENEGTVVATNKTRLVDPSLAQHRNTSSSVAGPDDQTRVVDSQSDRVSKEAGSGGPPSGIEFIGKTKFTDRRLHRLHLRKRLLGGNGSVSQRFRLRFWPVLRLSLYSSNLLARMYCTQMLRQRSKRMKKNSGLHRKPVHCDSKSFIQTTRELGMSMLRSLRSSPYEPFELCNARRGAVLLTNFLLSNKPIWNAGRRNRSTPLWASKNFQLF